VNVIKDPFRSVDLPKRGIVTIGNFDGVHRGHLAMLREVVDRAKDRGVPAIVITFDPHPLKVLAPDRAPLLLQTPQQREESLAECGIDTVVVIPFTKEFSQIPAEDFVKNLLVKKLAITEIHVGERFVFGRDRGGNVDLLKSIGAASGFSVQGITDILDEEGKISSSRIRQAVLAGDVASARKLLGRPYGMDGTVARGDRMGRKIGFPTMNLKAQNQLFPKNGVYLGRVLIRSFERPFNCVTNVGTRPTVYENFATTIESYILDFSSDVYAEPVRLQFIDRLRDEMVFPSMLELTSQIRRDVEQARRFFLTRPLE
jgi:riboflavin kinase/FMN adenylyltransferase